MKKGFWLDLDGVVFDFEKHFLEYLNLPTHHADDWNDPRFRENLYKVAWDDNFWVNLPTIFDPKILKGYNVQGYCTSRDCHKETVIRSLWKNGFPEAKVLVLGFGEDKLSHLKGEGCEIMVDDGHHNYTSLTQGGVDCYLMTRPHNTKFDVGSWRVNTIEEFLERL